MYRFRESEIINAMRKFLILFAITGLLASCSTVRVAQDYEVSTDFNNYKTYGYFKQGIDAAEINDLDKKRILKAIDNHMLAAGYVKSETPDMMISIFTDTQQRVDVFNNWGWGMGFGGWGWGGFGWGMPMGNQVSTTNEGILYIDFIDTNQKELIWQGIGRSALRTGDPVRKTERINLIVKEILAQYPPQQ